MEQEYDYIVLGTGLKECILSGLMSTQKKKVLHMDRNAYYGGESASLNLEQLYKRFKGDKAVDAKLGRTRDYCVDLCPKFLMACGDLVKVLLHTRVTRYLEFKSVGGSYVLKGDKPHKVPSTPAEALTSDLMGMFQKRYYKNFLDYVYKYDHADAKTHKKNDLTKMTAKQLIASFSCDENTMAFTGHAIALYLDDDYLNKPALEFVERVKLYAYSVSKYGNSPYIYPIYGLGGLPEGFSRLCAIHGGTFMLNKPISKILYDKDGKVRGVESEGQEAYCKTLIADPSYFLGTDKIKLVGQVARCILILNAPIPGTNADSAQIIIPASQITKPGRKTDVYVLSVSYHHKVAAEGKYIAVISANVEGAQIPNLGDNEAKCEAGVRNELTAALKLIPEKSILESFFWVSDQYVANNDPKKDGCFISTSYDATSHFESAAVEVLSLYESITDKKLDLTISADPEKLSGEEEPVQEEEEGKEPASSQSAEHAAAMSKEAAEAVKALEEAAAAAEQE